LSAKIHHTPFSQHVTEALIDYDSEFQQYNTTIRDRSFQLLDPTAALLPWLPSI